MPADVSHLKVSAKADGPDATLVQPSDWNESHVFTCDSGNVLGRTTAGTGAVEEIAIPAGGFAGITALDGKVAKAGDTMTGPLAQAAGTAALPSYTFSGDTNTGIYSPGADQLAVSTGGMQAFIVDASRNVLVTGSGGLGYGVGSGGTVTQATSKSTTVALNKPSGTITMNNGALPGGSTANFICTNSLVGAFDIVVARLAAAFAENYRLRVTNDGGNIYFALTNNTGGSLSDAVILSFAVIKGATS